MWNYDEMYCKQMHKCPAFLENKIFDQQSLIITFIKSISLQSEKMYDISFSDIRHHLYKQVVVLVHIYSSPHVLQKTIYSLVGDMVL